MSLISRIFRKKYSQLFIYKWALFSAVIEILLIILATFSITNLYSILSSTQSMDNITYLMVFSFNLALFIVITFFVIFAMPLYLVIKKKAYSTAFSILLMTMAFVFLFFAVLLLLFLI